MNKKLLEEIDTAIKTEEVAIQVYVRNIESVLPLSGLSSEIQEKFKNTMHAIIDDSKDHKRKLELIRSRVKRGKI